MKNITELLEGASRLVGEAQELITSNSQDNTLLTKYEEAVRELKLGNTAFLRWLLEFARICEVTDVSSAGDDGNQCTHTAVIRISPNGIWDFYAYYTDPANPKGIERHCKWSDFDDFVDKLWRLVMKDTPTLSKAEANWRLGNTLYTGLCDNAIAHIKDSLSERSRRAAKIRTLASCLSKL